MTRRYSLLALITSVLLAGSAFAGSTTTTMTVSANVINNCTISAAPLAFGNYDPVSANSSSGVDVTGAANMTVACTQGDSFAIYLGQGANPAAGSTEATPLRQMANGANMLTYWLFQESGRITNWGNTVATSPAAAIVPSNAPVTVTVYGKLPKGQSFPAGAYSDSVIATINF